MTWSQLSFVEMFLEYGADCNSTGLWEQTGNLKLQDICYLCNFIVSRLYFMHYE